jgi:glycosyltransferase involved in cell wall biosynthesis
MKNKKITFLITTYNHANFIEECLQSIESQTHLVDQLIIADDCSQDGTQEKIYKFLEISRIKDIVFIERKKNIGLIKNLNGAIQKISGDYVFTGSGDDYSSKNRVEVSLRHFDLNNSISVIYSSYKITNALNQVKGEIRRAGFYKDPMLLIKKGAGLAPFGSVFKSPFLQSLCLVDRELGNEDDFICMAALLSGGLLVVPDVLYFYRVHKNSLSGWSVLESDDDKYIEKFIEDQKNRKSNYVAWNQLIESADIKNKLNMLESIRERIEIANIYENIREKTSVKHKVSRIIKYRHTLNKFDAVIILFGINAIFFIRYLKKLRLKI